MVLLTLGIHEMPPDVENEYIKMLVCEEMVCLIKEILKERSRRREAEGLKELEASKFNDTSSNDFVLCLTPAVTPPSTPTSHLQSTTSSPDHVQLVTTPLPTPPQSPTPSVQQQVENSMESDNIRIPTPKSSLSSSTHDEVDSLVDNLQPEVVIDSNLSSPSTTQPTLSAGIHTPQASSESSKKPPTAEEPAIAKHNTE